MVMFLPEAKQRPSAGATFAQGLGGGFTQGMQQEMEFAREMALKKQANQINFSQQLMKEEHKAGIRKEEKNKPIRDALTVVKRQLERIKSGKLGPKSGWSGGLYEEPKLSSAMSKEGREVRSGYEQAGKSLIGLASTLPIRNKLEFETLGEKLYDPTLSTSEMKGIYEEMVQRLEDSLGEGEDERSSEGGIVEMRDANGEVFDIPKELVEKARLKGFR